MKLRTTHLFLALASLALAPLARAMSFEQATAKVMATILADDRNACIFAVTASDVKDNGQISAHGLIAIDASIQGGAMVRYNLDMGESRIHRQSASAHWQPRPCIDPVHTKLQAADLKRIVGEYDRKFSGYSQIILTTANNDRRLAWHPFYHRQKGPFGMFSYDEVARVFDAANEEVAFEKIHSASSGGYGGGGSGGGPDFPTGRPDTTVPPMPMPGPF